jgi:hypothetical protein
MRGGPVTSAQPVTRWRLRRTAGGLRLGQLRAFGSEAFTWAELLAGSLADVHVFALYFPSRFDLPVDAAATEALRDFGARTPKSTSVDFWDPTDEHFSEALGLFGLRNPPALVLVTGLQDHVAGAAADSLYCISFADSAVLTERASLAAAVNIAHEVLVRCDKAEIAGYIRGQKIKALLAAVGRGAGVVRDEIVQLHPKFSLPGGFSVELG